MKALVKVAVLSSLSSERSRRRANRGAHLHTRRLADQAGWWSPWLVALIAGCSGGGGAEAEGGSGGSPSADGAAQGGVGGSAGSGAGPGGGDDAAGGSSGSDAGSAGTGGDPDPGGPAPTSGCGQSFAPSDIELEQRRGRAPMQVARRQITINSVPREYLLAVPADYDSNHAYPLVFGFHGSGGSREQLRGYMDVETAAGGQAIFIYPGGLLLPDRGSTGWNLTDGSDDLSFVDTLLEKYTSELCVDRNRLFATGHSFGGCMSNAVGCFRGDVFRAIAPVAGCGPNTRAECTGQLATLQIHSPYDTSTRYSGAISACTRYLRANQCAEQPACGCHWVDALNDPSNECIQEAQEPYDPGVAIEVTDRDDQPPIFRQYVDCHPDYPVVFIDHWRRERSPDDTREERWHNPPPWSPAVIWNFFTRLRVPMTP